ncbi:tetratricopeptide repeat protein [Methylomonas sp. MgM2]
MSDTINVRFFQSDKPYYTYNKPLPLYKRLFFPKGTWSPYCEPCGKWVHIDYRVLGIAISNNELSELDKSEIIKRMLDQDWSVLKTIERPHDWHINVPMIFIALGRCQTCDGPLIVLGETRGQASNGTMYMGTIFSMELDKTSALELLEIAIDRNLAVNETMEDKVIDLCKALGSAKDFVQVALIRQRRKEAWAFGQRGAAALGKHKLDEAEEAFNNALQIFKELNDRKSQAVTYSSLGSVYGSLGTLDAAVTSFKSSMALFEELDSKPDLANVYGSLSQIHYVQKKFDQAEIFIRKTLELETTLGNKQGMIKAYHGLGLTQIALDKQEQAKDAFAEGLRLSKEIGDKASAKTFQIELDRTRLETSG